MLGSNGTGNWRCTAAASWWGVANIGRYALLEGARVFCCTAAASRWEVANLDTIALLDGCPKLALHCSANFDPSEHRHP
jgi:hypothetical protein